MKIAKNKQSLWAAFIFMVLVLLVVIQIIWIQKAACLEEQNFNHRVSKALSSVRDELGKRVTGCNHMRDYLCGNSCPLAVRQLKIDEIDSIIRSNLSINNIELDYRFEIGDSLSLKAKPHSKQTCYIQSLNGLIQKDGIRLNVRFPDRNQFLMAQMKGWFIISLLFIAFVAISFVIFMRQYNRERAQHAHTTDFINNMVHEFQTPLAIMRLAAGLVRKKNTHPEAPKINDYLDVIVAENQKMELNVKRILQFATLGQQPEPMSNVSFHKVIEQVLQQLSFCIQSSGANVETHLKAQHDEVWGIEDHFVLMLTNIIDNSLKYGRQTPHIAINTSTSGNQLIVSVSDNGCGIDESHLPYIFDRYYRVPAGDVHNVKGFGLGLAYVKKITDLYQGTIQVASQPEKGTTFTLKFPLCHAR